MKYVSKNYLTIKRFENKIKFGNIETFCFDIAKEVLLMYIIIKRNGGVCDAVDFSDKESSIV